MSGGHLLVIHPQLAAAIRHAGSGSWVVLKVVDPTKYGWIAANELATHHEHVGDGVYGTWSYAGLPPVDQPQGLELWLANMHPGVPELDADALHWIQRLTMADDA